MKNQYYILSIILLLNFSNLLFAQKDSLTEKDLYKIENDSLFKIGQEFRKIRTTNSISIIGVLGNQKYHTYIMEVKDDFVNRGLNIDFLNNKNIFSFGT